MKNKILVIFSVAIILISVFSCGKAEPFNIADELVKIPGIELKEIEAKPPFKRIFEIRLTQILDHENPGGETFIQKLTLSHVDENQPTVLVTEGYSMRHNYLREVSELLNANQIRVEHRFFGNSKPNTKKWEFLNLKQAANDYHRIVGLFKKIYKNKWLSVGWSKGGQTSLAYRNLYPDDISVTIAYDAPLNFSLHEPRIDQFFEVVGSESCRQKLKAFQRLALKKMNGVLPYFKEFSKKKGYN